jgi:hypothetical protein
VAARSASGRSIGQRAVDRRLGLCADQVAVEPYSGNCSVDSCDCGRDCYWRGVWFTSGCRCLVVAGKRHPPKAVGPPPSNDRSVDIVRQLAFEGQAARAEEAVEQTWSMSGIGPSATSLDVRCLIAIGGKADEARTGQNRRS